MRRARSRLAWSDIAEFVQRREPESAELDFKREVSNEPTAEDGMHKLRCDAVALANARGGRLILGIADGKHVAGKFSGIDTAKAAQQAKEALACNIEPPLEYDLYTRSSPDNPTESVVVIEIEEGRELHCVARAGATEYWVRRADSNRRMTGSEIRQRHSAKNPPVTEALALSALGIWELRRMPKLRGPTFEMDPEELRLHLLSLRQVSSQCNDAPMVAAEVSARIDEEFTDAIQRGGWLENYLHVASVFEEDIEQALGEAEFEGFFRYVFERGIWFGHMLSYQSSRRLAAPHNRLLIALGARLLGLAVSLAEDFGNEAAVSDAVRILRDQRQYYVEDAELLACFDFALTGHAGHFWREKNDAPALFFQLDEFALPLRRNEADTHLFIESRGGEGRQGSLRNTWRLRLRWKLEELREGFRSQSYRIRGALKRARTDHR